MRGTLKEGEGETDDGWSLARYTELDTLLITGVPCWGADILTTEVFVLLLNCLILKSDAVAAMFLPAVACEGIPS